MQWLKKLFKGISAADTALSVWSFAKTVFWPAFSATMTAVFGYLGDIPIMWIIMATALVFMAVMVGIFYGNVHIDRKRPQHKLRYQGTMVNHDLVELNRSDRRNPKAVQRKVEKIQIGVSLQNVAPFPISAFLESAETEVETIKPPRAKYPKDPVLILPGNTVFFADDAIEMGGFPCKKLEGKMDISIRYGKPGKEIYYLKFKGKVEALMQHDGFMSANYTHWDSQQIGG